MSEYEAINALQNLGYKTIQINRELSNQPAGTVIAQSPTFSSAPHVDLSTTIVLTVSKGSTEDPTTGNGDSFNDVEGMN